MDDVPPVVTLRILVSSCSEFRAMRSLVKSGAAKLLASGLLIALAMCGAVSPKHNRSAEQFASYRSLRNRRG
jgi:hypothetical protein